MDAVAWFDVSAPVGMPSLWHVNVRMSQLHPFLLLQIWRCPMFAHTRHWWTPSPVLFSKLLPLLPLTLNTSIFLIFNFLLLFVLEFLRFLLFELSLLLLLELPLLLLLRVLVLLLVYLLVLLLVFFDVGLRRLLLLTLPLLIHCYISNM